MGLNGEQTTVSQEARLVTIQAVTFHGMDKSGNGIEYITEDFGDIMCGPDNYTLFVTCRGKTISSTTFAAEAIRAGLIEKDELNEIIPKIDARSVRHFFGIVDFE